VLVQIAPNNNSPTSHNQPTWARKRDGACVCICACMSNRRLFVHAALCIGSRAEPTGERQPAERKT
jgi:hypothetical protein